MTEGQKAYAKYRESAHWERLRLEVLRRDGHVCVRCGSGRKTEPHHIIYRARFEDSIPADLITLCRSCHKKAHGITTPDKPRKKKHRRKRFKKFRGARKVLAARPPRLTNGWIAIAGGFLIRA